MSLTSPKITDPSASDGALARPACVQVQYRVTGDPRDYQSLDFRFSCDAGQQLGARIAEVVLGDELLRL